MVSSSEGDILVFLPGAEEILSLKRLLAEKIATLSEFRTQFNVVKRIVAAAKKDPKTHSILFHSDPESPERAAHLEAFFGARFSNEEQQALASALAAEDNSRTVVVWSSSNDTETAQNWVETEWLLLPLFAALSADEQSKVFAPPNSLRERKVSGLYRTCPNMLFADYPVHQHRGDVTYSSKRTLRGRLREGQTEVCILFENSEYFEGHGHTEEWTGRTSGSGCSVSSHDGA